MFGNMQLITDQTQAKVAKMIQAMQNNPALRKTIDASSGLTGISLDAPAKQLVPLMSPFRQTIPREIKSGSDSAQWKDILTLGSPKLSSAERTAGELAAVTVNPRSAAYKVMRLGGEVTREAEAKSGGFDPALAKESSNQLLNFSKLEEIVILGGNVTALGQVAGLTVTLVNNVPLSTFSTENIRVRVAAVTLSKANRHSLDRPTDFDSTGAGHGGVLSGKNRTDVTQGAAATPNTDREGIGDISAEVASGVLSGTDPAVKIEWNPIPGAAGYIVWAGTAAGDANLKTEAFVTQSSITLRSLNGGGTTAVAQEAAGDTSGDALSYDGIIAQALAGNAVVIDVNGKLSGTASTGEITEYADACQQLWDKSKIGKFRILVAGQESRALTARGAVSNALQIHTTPIDGSRGSIMFGSHVGQLMNPVTGDINPVETLPWLSGGTMILMPMEIPFKDANTPSPVDMAMQYDVERWDYGSSRATGPIWTFDIMNFGVLRMLFSGGFAILHNIRKG